MAEVSMDLNELKSYESQIKEATAAADRLQDKLNEKEKELVALEANKMVIKKTIYPKYVNVPTVTPDKSTADTIARSVVGKCVTSNNPEARERGIRALSYELQMTRFCVADYNQNYLQPEKDTTEYINFDDVQRELRERAEASVAEELGELREKVRHQTAEKAQMNQKFTEEYTKQSHENAAYLVKAQDKMEELKAECNKQLDEWQQKYEDLKNDKDMRTTQQKLEAKIAELEDQLFEAEGKTWLQKLFGK